MIKKLLHISCKNATLLICQNEEVRLDLVDRLRLKLHLSICTACKLFKDQNHIINKMVKHKMLLPDVEMDFERKEVIKTLLREEEK